MIILNFEGSKEPVEVEKALWYYQISNRRKHRGKHTSLTFWYPKREHRSLEALFYIFLQGSYFSSLPKVRENIGHPKDVSTSIFKEQVNLEEYAKLPMALAFFFRPLSLQRVRIPSVVR